MGFDRSTHWETSLELFNTHHSSNDSSNEFLNIFISSGCLKLLIRSIEDHQSLVFLFNTCKESFKAEISSESFNNTLKNLGYLSFVWVWSKGWNDLVFTKNHFGRSFTNLISELSPFFSFIVLDCGINFSVDTSSINQKVLSDMVSKVCWVAKDCNHICKSFPVSFNG